MTQAACPIIRLFLFINSGLKISDRPFPRKSLVNYFFSMKGDNDGVLEWNRSLWWNFTGPVLTRVDLSTSTDRHAAGIVRQSLEINRCIEDVIENRVRCLRQTSVPGSPHRSHSGRRYPDRGPTKRIVNVAKRRPCNRNESRSTQIDRVKGKAVVVRSRTC